MRSLRSVNTITLLAVLAGSTEAQARARTASATPATPATTGYVVDYWNTETGLPQNSVNAIMQSRDGYLWLATFGGVARFDGASFVSITTGTNSGLTSDRVRTVAQGLDGRLWIGTEAGLARSDRDRVTMLTIANGLPGDVVTALAAARNGSMWVGTANGGLARVDGSGVHAVVPALGVLGNLVDRLIVGRGDTLWIAARSGIWKLPPGVAGASPIQVLATRVTDRIPPMTLAPDSTVWAFADSSMLHFREVVVRFPIIGRIDGNSKQVRSIAAAPDGALWISGVHAVWRFRPDSNTLTTVALSSQSIVSLLVDREGSLWAGDRVNGLARIRPTLFTAFTESDGLSSDNVVSVFADSRDRVWVASRCLGLAVKDGARFSSLDVRAKAGCATTFAEDTTGAIWIGADRVARWRDGIVAVYDSTNGLSSGPVRSLYRDRRGTIWIATRRGLAFWDGRRFVQPDSNGTAALTDIRVMYQSRDSVLWLGSERGLIRYANGRFSRFTTANGLANDFVRGIHEDTAGNLWIATYGGGLSRLSHGSFETFNTASGLYDNYLSSVIEDGAGNLWFSSNRGVFRVARADLEAAGAKRAAKVHSVVYGRADGMMSSEANGGFQWGVTQTRDGRLWYPTLGGIAVIDPRRALQSVPPTVALERVVVDGVAQRLGGSLDVGPGVSTIEVAYSGLSLNTPSAVTFRYKLDGWDHDWIDAGAQHSVFYSRLPHGHYRFHVVAANREGVRAADEAVLEITIAPYFWQTWWFRIFASAAAIAAIVAAVRARIHRVHAAATAAARAAAQKRELHILESITDGFIALDGGGKLIYANKTAERVIGKSATALTGSTLTEAIPAARGTLVEWGVSRVAESRTPAVFEACDVPATGTWLEIRAYPTDDGTSVYFADITARKEAEEELRNQKEEIEAQAEELAQQTDELSRQNEILEENVRLKDEVERIARHDIRSPVNTIISLSQIVRDDVVLPPEHEASMRLIEQAGRRVLRMASLTLDLFKMEQGTYELAPQPIDLQAAVATTLVELDAVIRTREVICTTTLTGFDGAPLARGDEVLCLAMLGNIVRNAIEASSAGGRVTIAIKNGDRLTVSVHNAGVVPGEIRDRFFEKYATAGKRGGTGLGAYSARLMARTMGGDITFSSGTQLGTTVVVELLPAQVEPPSNFPEGSAADPVSAGDDRPARLVLVVDDDSTNRIVVRHHLRHPRWTIDEAENGPIAVRRAAQREYDVILMDIEMPMMDGVETVQRIRAAEAESRDKRATIIAFSSHDDEPTRARALAAGCDDYLVKPASRQALVAAVLGLKPVDAAVASLDPAIRDLIPMFVDQKRGEVDALRAAIAAADLPSVRRLTHRLRGSFALYGMHEAANVCIAVDAALVQNRITPEADWEARRLYELLEAAAKSHATKSREA